MYIPANAADLPRIVMTVHCKTLPGTQVMGLVRQAANSTYTSFVANERFLDGSYFEIGQNSGDTHRQLRVVPSLVSPFFDPDGTYSEVLVTSHNWGHNRSNGFTNPMGGVTEFASRFKEAAKLAAHTGTYPCFPDRTSADPSHASHRAENVPDDTEVGVDALD